MDTGSDSRLERPLTHRAASGPACLLLCPHVSGLLLPTRSHAQHCPHGGHRAPLCPIARVNPAPSVVCGSGFAAKMKEEGFSTLSFLSV